jgi:hypothetical protein
VWSEMPIKLPANDTFARPVCQRGDQPPDDVKSLRPRKQLEHRRRNAL